MTSPIHPSVQHAHPPKPHNIPRLRRKRSNSDTHLHYIRTQSAHRSTLFQAAMLTHTSDPLTSLLAQHKELRTHAEALIADLPKNSRLRPIQCRDDGYAHYDKLAKVLAAKDEDDRAGFRFRWYVSSPELVAQEGTGRAEGVEEGDLRVFMGLRACAEETTCIVAKTKRMGVKGCLGGREWAWGVAALAVGYSIHDATLLRLKALLQYQLRRLDESPGLSGGVADVMKAAVRVWAMLEHDLKNVRLLYLVDVVDAWGKRMTETPGAHKQKSTSVDGFPFPLLSAVPDERRRKRVTTEVSLPDPFVDGSNEDEERNRQNDDFVALPPATGSDEYTNNSDSADEEDSGDVIEIGYKVERMSMRSSMDRAITS